MFRSLALLALMIPSQAGLASGKDRVQTEPASNIRLTAGPAQSQAMFDAIARMDRALFDASFASCDPERLRQLVAEDFEFYHDKEGLTSTSGEQFVREFGQHCERLKQGTDFRARRELVPGSMAVYPLNNYGAVQTGVHRFYALVEGEPDRLTETARFLHIWKQVDGEWKLARVVSYDHKLAE